MGPSLTIEEPVYSHGWQLERFIFKFNNQRKLSLCSELTKTQRHCDKCDDGNWLNAFLPQFPVFSFWHELPSVLFADVCSFFSLEANKRHSFAYMCTGSTISKIYLDDFTNPHANFKKFHRKNSTRFVDSLWSENRPSRIHRYFWHQMFFKLVSQKVDVSEFFAYVAEFYSLGISQNIRITMFHQFTPFPS